MARAIGDHVRAKHTPQVNARLAGARSVKPDVDEVYLEGRHFRRKSTAEGIKNVTGYFPEAIDA